MLCGSLSPASHVGGKTFLSGDTNMEKPRSTIVSQQVIEMMCCPRSGQNVNLLGNELVTKDGRFRYPVTESRIPQMYILGGEEWAYREQVTEKVKSFYEETPFPNYDDVDDVPSLINKARRSVYAKLLDEQLPFNIKVLKVGCGTGQLSNFLSMPNTVLGARTSRGRQQCARKQRFGEARGDGFIDRSGTS